MKKKKKQVEIQTQINVLLKQLGSEHHADPTRPLFTEMYKLEQLRKFHEMEANALGIALGAIKGTKTYAKLKAKEKTNEL